MTPITDPDLLRQLEAAQQPQAAPGDPAAAPAIPPGLTAVDPTTAKFLDQVSLPSSPPLWNFLVNSPIGGAVRSVANSPVGGMVRGARDVLDGGAQTLAHGLASIAPEGSGFQQWAQDQAAQTDEAVKNAARNYDVNFRQGAPPSVDLGRVAGNILTTAPLVAAMPGAAAPSLAGRMASGAAGGALSGALEPVQNNLDDFWAQKAKQALLGAGVGAAAPAVMGGIARVVRPDTSPEVQTLMENGVRPTVGEMMGGAFNRAEQGLTSVPVVGDFIKNARRDAVMQFDRGAINKALAPIGETLGAPEIGRDAIAEMQSKIGAAYDRIVPNLGISAIDPATGGPSAAAAQLSGDLGTIMKMSAFMPADRATQLRNILQSQILDKISSGGGMTGESFQEAKSELGRMATEYLHSPVADERQLGGALLQSQVALRDALRTANPGAAQDLANADNAFAHLLRVQNAAARVGGEPGAFSPAQLQSATRALDPSLRKRAFAAGDALMQNYAEAGRGVLGNTVPDSGTPFRHALQLGVGLLAGHAGGEALGLPPQLANGAAIGAAGLTGLTGLLYSPGGRAIVAHLLASRPQIAGPIAQGVRAATPVATAGAAPVVGAFGF